MSASSSPDANAGPRLGVRHLRIAAAPRPLLVRRDRPFDATAPAVGVADALRYVALARRTLPGPLALEIEGPGDPLASPETVLRCLALLHDHHPDVMTGLVIEGPLLAEYADDLLDFDLRYLVLRIDAATQRAARCIYEEAYHRGDHLERDEAAALAIDEGHRALGIARRHRIPVAVRFTLIPTVNAREVAEVASIAREGGAQRFDVVPHEPLPWAPLARAGSPTAAEMAAAIAAAARAFGDPAEPVVPSRAAPMSPTLAWLAPDRMQPVDTDALAAMDVLRTLPEPDDHWSEAPVLPPRRAQLIAVATADGTLVDHSLAAAPSIRLYAVTPETIRLVGARPLPSDARRRHDGVGEPRSFLEALVGCRAGVATHIPPRAVTLLRAVGITPVACGGLVTDVIDRVARGTFRIADEA